jgi:anti-sigma factor RsiW
MNITPDVIADLLPVYLAGEASPGTRALLEEYLRENPAFAKEVREHAERGTALLAAVSPQPALADSEKATLERVRRFNRYRSYVLALSLAFTLLPFSFAFTSSGVNWVMLRDNPRQAVFLLIGAVGCWLVYYRMGRRLRTPRA